jgi:hypothetical protein
MILDVFVLQNLASHAVKGGKNFHIIVTGEQLYAKDGTEVYGTTTYKTGKPLIELSKSSFKNNSRLALTLGHEMIHVIDFYNAGIYNWADNPKLQYKSEVNAWSWSKEWGYYATGWDYHLPRYEKLSK